MNREKIEDKIIDKDFNINEDAMKVRKRIEELEAHPRDVLYHALDRFINYLSKNKPEDLSDEIMGLIDDIKASKKGIQDKHIIDDLKEVREKN